MTTMTTSYQQFEEGFLKQAAEAGADVDVLRGIIAEQADLMQKWSAAFDEAEQITGDKLFRYKLAGELAELYKDNAAMVKEAAGEEIWPMIQAWLANPDNQKVLMGAGGGGLLGLLLGGKNRLLGGMLGGLGGGLGMYGYQNGWFDKLKSMFRGNQQDDSGAGRGAGSGASYDSTVAQTIDDKNQAGVLAQALGETGVPGMRDSDISGELARQQSVDDYLRTINNSGLPTEEDAALSAAGVTGYNNFKAKEQATRNEAAARQLDPTLVSGSDEPAVPPTDSQFVTPEGIVNYTRGLTGARADQQATYPRVPMRASGLASLEGPPVQATDPNAGGVVDGGDSPANPDADELLRDQVFAGKKKEYDAQMAVYNKAVDGIKRKQKSDEATANRDADNSFFGVNTSKAQPTKAELIKRYGVGGGEVRNTAEDIIRGIHTNVVQPAQVAKGFITGGLDLTENSAVKGVGRGISGLAGAGVTVKSLGEDLYDSTQRNLGEIGLGYRRMFKTPPAPKPQPLPTAPVAPVR